MKPCVEDRSRDAYCPSVNPDGTYVKALNWSNPKRISIVNKIQQYPLIELVELDHILKLKKALSWEYIPFRPIPSVEYQSSISGNKISFNHHDKLYLVTLNNGQKYMVIENYEEPTELEPCVEDASRDAYCPKCNKDGTCSTAFNWHPSKDVRTKINIIKGYKLISEQEIEDLLNEKKNKIIFIRSIDYLIDPQIAYVSYLNRKEIPVTHSKQLHIVNFNTGQSYAVFLD